MSFSNSVRNIASIGGYDQAARHFAETKKPKTARWADDERPLYNTRSLHYKIVRGANADYFDLVNYDTALIRYYRPNANGDQRILVRDWDSMVSRQFLFKHRWYNSKCLTVREADGTERSGRLLLNRLVGDAEKHGVPRGWSADIMMVAGNEDNPTIDITRSRHIPGMKAAATDEDKAKRKELKQLTTTLIDLLVHRIPEYTESTIDAASWVRNSAGEPFQSAMRLMKYEDTETIKVCLDLKENLDSEKFINAFVKLGHAVWTSLLGRAEYKAEQRWNCYSKKLEKPEYVPPTTDDFRTSMQSHLLSLCNLRASTGRVDIGQFPASIPSRWFL